MEILEEVIDTFSGKEIKEVKLFISNKKGKSERKEVVLLNCLMKDKANVKTLYYKKYPNTKDNAYHSARKRLVNLFIEFVNQQDTSDYYSNLTHALALLKFSIHLFDHQKNHLAWKYIIMAEDLAKKNEYYDVLRLIYNYQIEKTDFENSPPLDDLIKKHDDVKRVSEQYEKMNFALASIKEKVFNSKQNLTQFDIEHEVNEVLNKFDLRQSIIRSPKFIYSLLLLVRSVAISKKEYSIFTPFLMRSYNSLINNNALQSSKITYHLDFLYLISHNYYRNKKFNEAIEYLDLFKTSIPKDKSSIYNKYYPKYLIVDAANRIFLDKPLESIQLLNELLTSKRVSPIIEDQLNASLNLSIYYFIVEDKKRALGNIFKMRHTNEWYSKKMGMEWVMKKLLITAILLIESFEEEQALVLLSGILKKQEELFKIDLYKKARVFIMMMIAYIEDSNIVNKEEFINQFYYEYDNENDLENDLQSRMFFAWMKSKIVKKPYREVLLQVANYEKES